MASIIKEFVFYFKVDDANNLVTVPEDDATLVKRVTLFDDDNIVSEYFVPE